jgi:hypothetical protein
MGRTNNIDWTQIWTKLKKIKVTDKYGLGLELVFNATFSYMVAVSFDWWKKPEYPEKTTDLSQVTDKLTKTQKFQWKCLHNINYAEHRLEKMNLSNGKCRLCQIRDNHETVRHLIFKYHSVRKKKL